MKKKVIMVLVFVYILFLNISLLSDTGLKKIVMCRPLVSQIKNIVIMQELGVLPVKSFELICVYHENELTSYGASKKYVIGEGLHFVKFKKIRGRVKLENLFKKNKWSSVFEDIVRNSNGIIFTGGMDIPAQIYGEKNALLTAPTTPYRSYYEISFLFHLIGRGEENNFIPILEKRKNYPVLAICLGEQSLNVAAGGTLIQDIPGEVYGIKNIEAVVDMDRDKIHSIGYMKILNPQLSGFFAHFHKIKLKGNSLFSRIGINMKNNPFVLSSHHQAVEKLGKGLNIIALSMDGKIVEAIEHNKYKNVLGVQFHPEVYKLYKKNRLFRQETDKKISFNPRSFLIENKSMDFHLKIWKWFANCL